MGTGEGPQTAVLIAVQARSTSERLPRKSHELISGQRMLDRVLESCKRAALYINRPPISAAARVAVLCPRGDAIAKDFERQATIVEGSEHDVLSRYSAALEQFSPQYIVRVTADCPLIPPFVISKHVSLALANGYDYIANVDERWRTALDGVDCEVISSRLMKWAAEMAVKPYDREHVTPIIRQHPPEWAKIATTVGHFDMSTIKYSVDTPEDLARVRQVYDSANDKYTAAILALGKTSVHRF